MDKLDLNFFGELVTIKIPNSLTDLRQAICDQFSFTQADAQEVLISYAKNLKEFFIKTEDDFMAFVKEKIPKLNLGISVESQLYKKSMVEIKDETERKQKEMKELEKKIGEINLSLLTKFKTQKEEIQNLNRQITLLRQKKVSLKNEVLDGEAKLKKEKVDLKSKISKIKVELGLEAKEKVRPKPKAKVAKPAFIMKNKVIKKKAIVKPKGEEQFKEEGILKGLNEQMKKVKEILNWQENQPIQNSQEEDNKNYINIPLLGKIPSNVDALLNGLPIKDIKGLPNKIKNYINFNNKPALKQTDEFTKIKALNKKTEEQIKVLIQMFNTKYQIYIKKELQKEKDQCKVKELNEMQKKLNELINLTNSFSLNFITLTKKYIETSSSSLNALKTLVQNFQEKSKKSEENQPKQQELQRSIHQKTQCDGCGVFPIVGIRYKCAVCKNFDYCEACEAKNAEKHEHPFIKIYKPDMEPKILEILVGENCPNYQ